jgi:glycosyltransferase involved in cell wall biosynthesis
LNQSFTDFEVILVDDGSPDNCPQICDQYAQKDSRVKVIHKPNGGVSSARNAGLRESVGEYILFCDSDDYYLDDAFYKIHEELQEKSCDILNYGYVKEISVNGDQKKNSLRPSYSDHISDTFLVQMAFCWNWNDNNFFIEIVTHAFKRRLLIDNNIFFNEKLIRAEDSIFTLTAFSYAKNAKTTSGSLYFYRFNPISCMNTWSYNQKSISNSICFLRNVKEILSRKLIDAQYYEAYFKKSLVRVALNPCIAHAKHGKYTFKERRLYIKDILNWFYAALCENHLQLENGVGQLNAIETCLIARRLVIGIDLHTRLLALYEKIRDCV